MLYALRKFFRFEAAHSLNDSKTKFSNRHDHDWTGYIEVQGYDLIRDGEHKNMLIAQDQINEVAERIEGMFHGRYLNNILKTDMPTSEVVATHIWRFAREVLISEAHVSKVVIHETCLSECAILRD